MKRHLSCKKLPLSRFGLYAMLALLAGTPDVAVSATTPTSAVTEQGDMLVAAKKKRKTHRRRTKTTKPAPAATPVVPAPVVVVPPPPTPVITPAVVVVQQPIVQLTHVSPDAVELRKLILKGDWDYALNNPSFIEFVRSYTSKEVDRIDKNERTALWPELLAFLDKVEISDDSYEQIRKETVGSELQNLFPQLDHARGDFRYREMFRILNHAVEQKKQFGADQARVYYLMGLTLEMQRNYADAKRYYQSAAELEPSSDFYLAPHARMLTTLNNYAELEKLYRHMVEVRKLKLGPDHPEVAVSITDLARLLKDQGKYLEAEQLYGQVVAIYEKQLGLEHAMVAVALNNLGGILEMEGKYPEAEATYRRVLQIRVKNLGNEHPLVATSFKNLAKVLDRSEKYKESEEAYRRALEIDEAIYGPNHPEVGIDLTNLASSLKAQGRSAEAERLYRRAGSIKQQGFTKEYY